MPDDLDQLPTRELHDRALHRAEHHLDAKFLWELLEAIPVAEMAAGNTREADIDVVSTSNQIKDFLRSGDGELAEALRPLFVDYLRKHPEA